MKQLVSDRIAWNITYDSEWLFSVDVLVCSIIHRFSRREGFGCPMGLMFRLAATPTLPALPKIRYPGQRTWTCYARMRSARS